MKYVKRLDEMARSEYLEAGGKAANLGEMLQHGFNVPGGFCVTGKSLDYLLQARHILPKIMSIVETLNFDVYADIETKTAGIRKMISEAEMPADLYAEIVAQIEALKSPAGEDPFVAVRSSVAVKDSAVSSFPGMMDTYHFIKGQEQIVESIRNCWASLFTARAVYRRHQLNIPQDKGVIAPVIQRMVNADVAGVLFTANPVNNKRNEFMIESNWGLGESIVSGEAIVDYFILSRDGDTPGRIIDKRIGNKNMMVTIDREKGIGRKKYELTGNQITDCTLSDAQLMEIADVGAKIEAVFEYPQDVEWAYEKGKLFILQSRKVKGLKDGDVKT